MIWIKSIKIFIIYTHRTFYNCFFPFLNLTTYITKQEDNNPITVDILNIISIALLSTKLIKIKYNTKPINKDKIVIKIIKFTFLIIILINNTKHNQRYTANFLYEWGLLKTSSKFTNISSKKISSKRKKNLKCNIIKLIKQYYFILMTLQN